MQSVMAGAESANLNPKRVMDLELALEETLVNIINHAYPGNTDGWFEVSARVQEKSFIVEICDEGVPFDPTALKDPNLSQDIAERQIGGLGVFLIRKLMDDVKYRRENNRNILELCINLP